MTRREAEKRVVKAVFDTKSWKPACVLLQAVYGGDRGVCSLFNEWEFAPTKNMKMIEATWEEWQMAAKRKI